MNPATLIYTWLSEQRLDASRMMIGSTHEAFHANPRSTAHTLNSGAYQLGLSQVRDFSY